MIEHSAFKSGCKSATEMNITMQCVHATTPTTAGTKEKLSEADAMQETRHLMDTAKLSDRAVADELFLKMLRMDCALPFGSCAGTRTLYRVVIRAGSWFRLPSRDNMPEGVLDQTDHLMAAVITSKGQDTITTTRDRSHTALRSNDTCIIPTENTPNDASLSNDTLSDNTNSRLDNASTIMIDEETPKLSDNGDACHPTPCLLRNTSPGTSDAAEKHQTRGRGHYVNNITRASTIVFFDVGQLEMLDLIGITPIDDEDGEVECMVDFPHGYEIDAILDSTDKSWKEKVKDVQSLYAGEWPKWSSWKSTGFVVVAQVGPEGTSDGVHILADGKNPMGGSIPHHNCGCRFACARISDYFQDMEYHKEWELEPSTLVTGQIKMAYTWQDKNGIFRSIPQQARTLLGRNDREDSMVSF